MHRRLEPRLKGGTTTSGIVAQTGLRVLGSAAWGLRSRPGGEGPVRSGPPLVHFIPLVPLPGYAPARPGRAARSGPPPGERPASRRAPAFRPSLAGAFTA